MDLQIEIAAESASPASWYPRLTVARYGTFRVDVERGTSKDAALYAVYSSGRFVARIASLPGEDDCAQLAARAMGAAKARNPQQEALPGAQAARRRGTASSRKGRNGQADRDAALQEMWRTSLTVAPELKMWKRAEWVARQLDREISGVLKRAQQLRLVPDKHAPGTCRRLHNLA